MGAQLMEGIAEAGRGAGKNVRIRGVPTVFYVAFNEDRDVYDYRTLTCRDAAAYQRFFVALQERGVRTTPDGLWFVSTAHTQADIDQTLTAVADAMTEA
jgi:glutamate-1-semialdehyde 2,1-aminomutase